MDNQSAQNENILKRLLGHRIIFVILGIVILIEGGYLIKTLVLSGSVTPPSAYKASVKNTTSRITLTALQTKYAVKEIIPVSVMIDTGGHQIQGVDLIVHYDPKIFEVTPGAIIKGGIFDDYPQMSVDASKGLITISGISGVNNFQGSGQLAIVALKAKTPGNTSLTVDFKKGSTTASNMTEAGSTKNILENVENLDLIIQ